MKFTVLTDQEINQALQPKLLSQGPGSFEVIKAEETLSKAHHTPMLHLTLDVFDKDGTQGIIHDYMTATRPWKIKAFCESINNPQLYQQGIITSDHCLKQRGKLTIRIQQDKTGNYPDKPVVQAYLPVTVSELTATRAKLSTTSASLTPLSPPPLSDADITDDLPF